MMERTDVAAAINVTVEQVATYHTDPRGWRLFRRLNTAIVGPLLGRTGQHVYRSPNDFHGYARSPQRFTGAAYLGAARPVVPRSSRFTDEKEQNPSNDLADRVFLERMQRGRR